MKSAGQAVRAAFEEHALRADALALETAAMREPLRFVAGLYRTQSRMAERLCLGHAQRPLTGALESDAADPST